MHAERRSILDMLERGKIGVDDAEKLLDAIGETAAPQAVRETYTGTPAKARFLRVVVESSDADADKGERVDIRVPVQLLRAGIKLGALIPQHARFKIDRALDDKGININLKDIKPETVEEFLEGLSGLTVNVDGGTERVRVFCE